MKWDQLALECWKNEVLSLQQNWFLGCVQTVQQPSIARRSSNMCWNPRGL